MWYNYTHKIMEMITIMAQLQKQKVRLTDLLRNTIKELRKTYNKRGDMLSREINRGASYVSQLENGKIKDIEFDLLDMMFQHIIGASGDYYIDYIQKYIFDIINNIPSKESLFDEEWIHIFVMQNFKVEISENLIEIISKKLEQEGYTPEQLVKKINQNEFQRRWLDVKREINKAYITVSGYSYDNYSIHVDMEYSLPEDFISKILKKEITSASYVIMEGVLQNLYTINSMDMSGAIKRTEKILFDNGFFNTIEIYENLHKLVHQQQPLKIDTPTDNTADLFTFYDEVIVNYNEKYKNLKQQAIEKLNYAFDRYKDEHPPYACEALEKILNNMDCDLGLIVAILSTPLKDIPRGTKQFFWEDYKSLVERYSKMQL